MIEDLRAQGVKQIDALFISHAHGDHYGGLSKACKAFPVKWLYLPDPTELDKYQRTYGNSLRRQSKKVKNFRWYKQGYSAMIGEIKFRCLFDCKAKDLAEKVGAHCYSIADDGHVEIDITGKKVVVTTSKTGKHDSYTI